jgi:aminoglycoside phosphotransferase family enzyme/gluconate kinase
MANKVDSSLLIRSFSNPEFYPYKPSKVDFTQTQMSLIFLTGKYVYKLKKSVNLGYLDYTTLENRQYFCIQELELNRRLSPDVYLEVLPVYQAKNGSISITETGEIVEYAVKMKQLPLEKTMDNLLLNGKVTNSMVSRVAEKVAIFHKKAATSSNISRFGELSSIMVNIDENKQQAEKYIGTTISEFEYKKINEFNREFSENNTGLFRKRVEEGRIRDCHGDLHAAHICFSNSIDIFDCIEFNDRFRYCDVASEIAFLAMDIEKYDRPDLSRAFVDSYVEFSNDRELPLLLNFYKCYRACVRGKVESFKLDDPLITEKEKVLKAARNYFHLAYRYTMENPMLIVMAGLAGTGKTSLAQAISDSLGFTVLSSDVVRKELAGIPSMEHRFENYDSGIYSTEFTEKTYTELIQRARTALQSNKSVILDASFRKKKERAIAHRLASELNTGFLLVECILDKSGVKSRLEKRKNEPSVSDGRWEIFETQQQDSDKITEFSAKQHLVINTSGTIDESVKKILERIA